MRRKAAEAEVVDTYVLQKAIFGGIYISKGSTFGRFRGYKNTKSEAKTIIQIWILASPRRDYLRVFATNIFERYWCTNRSDICLE
jgi:hypothetical protein